MVLSYAFIKYLLTFTHRKLDKFHRAWNFRKLPVPYSSRCCFSTFNIFFHNLTLARIIFSFKVNQKRVCYILFHVKVIFNFELINLAQLPYFPWLPCSMPFDVSSCVFSLAILCFFTYPLKWQFPFSRSTWLYLRLVTFSFSV